MTDYQQDLPGARSAPVASVAAYRGLAPGWYRDETDPNLARYWDGHSLGEERRRVVVPTQQRHTIAHDSWSQTGGDQPDLPPAGWYRDRTDPSLARYWDGKSWSESKRRIESSATGSSSAATGVVTSPEGGDTPLPPPSTIEDSSFRRAPWEASSGAPVLLRSLFRQRLFWMVACLALMAAVGVVLAESGKSSPTVAGSPTVRGSSTTKSQTPSTTVATTTTTAPALPVAPQPSAEQAADALVANWAAGNRTVALSVATSAAVDTLFAISYPAGLAIDRGCSDGAPPVTCSFGPPGGGNPNDPIYSLSVSQAPGGWYVSAVTAEG